MVAAFTPLAPLPHESRDYDQTLPQSAGELRDHCLCEAPAGICVDQAVFSKLTTPLSCIG